MKPISTSAEGIRVPASTAKGACRTPRPEMRASRTIRRWTISARRELSLRAWPSARSARMPLTASPPFAGAASGPPFSISASSLASESVGSGERKYVSTPRVSRRSFSFGIELQWMERNRSAPASLAICARRGSGRSASASRVRMTVRSPTLVMLPSVVVAPLFFVAPVTLYAPLTLTLPAPKFTVPAPLMVEAASKVLVVV